MKSLILLTRFIALLLPFLGALAIDAAELDYRKGEMLKDKNST